MTKNVIKKLAARKKVTMRLSIKNNQKHKYILNILIVVRSWRGNSSPIYYYYFFRHDFSILIVHLNQSYTLSSKNI